MSKLIREWGEKILAGDHRSVARAISAIEKGDASGQALLKQVFPHTGNAFVVGVTGSPGTGKSTLVEKLAGQFRSGGTRVGIIAVDPTSPYSGGAILGDRIRMQSLSNDDGVYIRSMATRGELGGLAAAAHDAVSILDAAGCRVVIVETVGVGQDEVEVARLADVTLLLLVPGMGDDIQTFKAGVMEIADLFVINKADHTGAERVEQEVLAMLALASRADGWQPPVLRTVATTGAGVPELRDKLDEFRSYGEKELRESRRRSHCRARLLALLRQRLFERVVKEQLTDGALEEQIKEVLSHRRDPHSVIEELIADVTSGNAKEGRAGTRANETRIHHVGIAVNSLQAAIPVFTKILGRAASREEVVKDQKVRVAVFELEHSRIELLEATSPDSPVGRFLAKRGQGIHHLTLAVGNIRKALAELSSSGVQPIDREPRTGAGNESIAFLDPKTTSGVLIELVEGE